MRHGKKNFCGMRGSNTRPPDYETDALPTELTPLGALTDATTILSFYFGLIIQNLSFLSIEFIPESL